MPVCLPRREEREDEESSLPQLKCLDLLEEKMKRGEEILVESQVDNFLPKFLPLIFLVGEACELNDQSKYILFYFPFSSSLVIAQDKYKLLAPFRSSLFEQTNTSTRRSCPPLCFITCAETLSTLIEDKIHVKKLTGFDVNCDVN